MQHHRASDSFRRTVDTELNLPPEAGNNLLIMAARSVRAKVGIFYNARSIGFISNHVDSHFLQQWAIHHWRQPAFKFLRLMTTTTEASSVKTLSVPEPVPEPFAIQKVPAVLATIHKFPTMEPLRFQRFPSTFLFAPLRRDILHRAIVFEGDAHRLGRGKAQTRGDVHGSGKKIRPQKGSGMARLGDKKSPMLRGGGASHGPKPRDFSSKLPRKMYDLAWRTALSYRYRRGELIIFDNSLELAEADPGLGETILQTYGWGSENSRSLFITANVREKFEIVMKELGSEGRVLTMDEVDVKDLLETGRVIIEREALEWFHRYHGVDSERIPSDSPDKPTFT